jgi:hypothetical protein
MKLPSKQIIALNGVAAAVVLIATGTFVRDLISPPTIESCVARYHQRQSIKLMNGAIVLTPEDLQSSFNGEDRGVTEHMSITALKEGPAPVAMGIQYGKGSHFLPAAGNMKGGVSFPWRPSGLPADARAACLSYHVFVPNDFDFGQGGVLPSLMARDSDSSDETPDALETRIIWKSNGGLRTSVMRTADGQTVGDTLDGNSAKIEKGRWVRIDQEIILNTPKMPDGITRIWIDKALTVEATDVNMRTSPKVSQSGVQAATYFGGEGVGGSATKDEQLYFTPFELRWNK